MCSTRNFIWVCWAIAESVSQLKCGASFSLNWIFDSANSVSVMSVNTLSEFHPSSLVWACQSDSPVYPWLPPAHRQRQTRACHWLQYHSQSLDGRFTTISKRKQSNFWNVNTHNFFNKSSYQTDHALKSWPTICLYGCQCSPVCSGVSGTFHTLCRKLPAADRSAATPSCCASLTWEHSQLVGSPPTWATYGPHMVTNHTSPHFRCQKKKWPILWLVRAFLIRKRARGLSRYISYFSTCKQDNRQLSLTCREGWAILEKNKIQIVFSENSIFDLYFLVKLQKTTE